MIEYLEADRADFDAYIAGQLRGRSGPEREEVEGFLRAHPGSAARDWKGKGCEAPALDQADEAPWFDLREADVRALATATVARLLPRNVRQAAGRDASLIWNPLARKYRLRLDAEKACAAPVQYLAPAERLIGPYGPSGGRETAAPIPTPVEKFPDRQNDDRRRPSKGNQRYENQQIFGAAHDR